MYTIDIDVGGTLTDGIFADDTRLVASKVDTTPHDLTVCFFDCMADGARKLGFPELTSLLRQTDLIRWSTTITSNVLAEGRGAKLGLILTKGHGRSLYGAFPSPAIDRIVALENVVAIGDNPEPAEILRIVQYLLERGVRRICVSLHGAFRDPAAERRVKAIVEAQYPDHYLGSVPVLLGSDIVKSPDDMTRTHCALINAYTHAALATALFKAEDDLREVHGFTRPFLVSHINGGVAGVSKARAIDTIESGPIAGLYATSHFARLYGLEKVVALDVGGTTAKVGMVLNGAPASWRQPTIFDIPVSLALPYLRSVSLGGGSVARVAAGPAGDQLTLGPESMGSYPGPACYGLGGDRATLTDAFLTAGLLNPRHFLAGARTLDPERAAAALDAHVARPLGVTLDAAARAVVDRACTLVAETIRRMLDDLVQDPAGCSLFAFGGNGGLFACEVARRLAPEQVYVFSLGPVFSAFGTSISDLEHIYDQALGLPLRPDPDVAGLAAALNGLTAEGLRDMRGEGAREDQIERAVVMEVRYGDQRSVTIQVPPEAFNTRDDVERLLERHADPVAPPAARTDVVLDRLRVRFRRQIPKPRLREEVPQAEDPRGALTGSRPVTVGAAAGQARVYRWESLSPGNVVEGAAVLESDATTYFVPEGWVLRVDRYRNGVIRPK